MQTTDDRIYALFNLFRWKERRWLAYFVAADLANNFQILSCQKQWWLIFANKILITSNISEENRIYRDVTLCFAFKFVLPFGLGLG